MPPGYRPSKAVGSHSTSLGDRELIIAQGKLIDAVLESAVNTDQPGMLRALVANDIYGDSGRTVLLPRGSRLIGQYNSDVARGQSRVFVIWQRVIRPDGIDVQLDSGGTDSLGQAGVEGKVNNHFWTMFGAATLLSVIGGFGLHRGSPAPGQQQFAFDLPKLGFPGIQRRGQYRSGDVRPHQTHHHHSSGNGDQSLRRPRSHLRSGGSGRAARSGDPMTHTALETFLAPLASCLAPEGVSEVSINKPQEAWIETNGEMRREDLPDLDATHLKMLAGLIAEFTQQDLSPEKPLLSATLPEGYRVQIVLPPAAQDLCLSIRKPAVVQYDLAAYEALGAFQSTVAMPEEAPQDSALMGYLRHREYRSFPGRGHFRASKHPHFRGNVHRQNHFFERLPARYSVPGTPHHH